VPVALPSRSASDSLSADCLTGPNQTKAAHQYVSVCLK
jgi:hypothetical protein